MNPGSSVQAVAIRPVIDTRADDMRMIQASTVTSDLEVARKVCLDAAHLTFTVYFQAS
jgi:hypothetical protein